MGSLFFSALYFAELALSVGLLVGALLVLVGIYYVFRFSNSAGAAQMYYSMWLIIGAYVVSKVVGFIPVSAFEVLMYVGIALGYVMQLGFISMMVGFFRYGLYRRRELLAG